MANMLVCTGKKRAVKKVMDYFLELNSKKTINIIAHVQRTKKAMIWNYEELKVLFQKKNAKTKTLEIDQKLIKACDFLQLRHPRGVVIKMTSFSSEESDLKWNIISRTTSFQLRGGKVDIREDVDTQGRREKRTCHITAAGPCSNVLLLKDLLIKEKVIDPKTVEFLL